MFRPRTKPWLTLVAFSAALVSMPSQAQTPEQGWFEWSSMPFGADVYRKRREAMFERLREVGGGVFLVPARAGRSDGFTFRQLDDFIYFTGLELPDAVLVLDAGENRVTVFSAERDARFDNPSRRNDFPGRRITTDSELAERSGIGTFRPIEQLAAAVAAWVDTGQTLRINLGRRGPVENVTTGFVRTFSPADALVLHLQQSYPSAKLDNAYDPLARVRAVHDEAEIAAMRKVCELTVEAIRHAAGFIREGADERGLEAELEAAFKRGGSQRLAFASIIKSGPNSLWPWRILAASYDRRNRMMDDGDLVVFDVGTELDYYVSDVGRTFPVSGKFTDRQRRALTMSTAVSDTIIAAVRPGVSFKELKELALSKIPPEERQYMQAGGFYGHHIGLSTGDPVLTELPLEAGMIFTVEPWYYNHDEGVSVFVEDVVLVTKDGFENLTAGLPRTPEALEAMTGARR